MDGDTNRVADCLSRYYENDGLDDHHPDHDFVSADVKLNPDGELIPIQRYTDMCTAATRRSTHLAEKAKQRVLDSNWMNEGAVDTVTDPDPESDPLAITSRADGQSLRVRIERDIDLTRLMRSHYHKDPIGMKILNNPEVHPYFRIKNKLIWTKNQMGRDVICIPQNAFIWGRWLIEVIFDQAHTTIGHFGQLPTSCYV